MAARLNLSLTDRSKERLDALVRRTEAETYSDVIRNALRLYEWAIGATEMGNRFCLKRSDGSIVEIELWFGEEKVG